MQSKLSCWQYIQQCIVIVRSFLRLLKPKLAVYKPWSLGGGGLTRCHGVLDHGLNLHRSIPLTICGLNQYCYVNGQVSETNRFLLTYELQSSEVIRLPTFISKYVILGATETLLTKIPTPSGFSKLAKTNLSVLKWQSPPVAVEFDVRLLSVGRKAGSMTLYSHKSDGWVNLMLLETTVPLTKENIFSVSELSQHVVSTIYFG